MITPPLPPHRLVKHWQDRHPYPVSFILHMIGIPPTILGALLIPVYLGLRSWPIFLLALGSFVGGYAFQFAGHLWEGTTPGEIIYFKRKLGWSYVEFPTLGRAVADFRREERHERRPVPRESADPTSEFVRPWNDRYEAIHEGIPTKRESMRF